MRLSTTDAYTGRSLRCHHANGSIDNVTDLITLVLPVRIVSNPQMKFEYRLAMISIFWIRIMYEFRELVEYLKHRVKA